MFTDASGVGVIREGKAGGVSGAQLVGRISSLELRRGGSSRELLCNEELFWLRPGVACRALKRVLACLSEGVM